MRSDAPSPAQCKRAETVFNDVHEPGYRYAMRKRIGARAIQDYLAAEELWEGFPDDWEEHAVSMLVVGAVFGRTDRVAAFLRGTKEAVRGDLVPMIRRWRERPWVWAVVEVVEDLGDRRLLVEPVGAPPSTWRNADDWGPIVVYSRSISQNYDNGTNLFFIQLVDVGPAYVTNGVIIPLRGFQRTDALFYADVVANALQPAGAIPLLGVADESTPVSDIAAADTVPFLALFRYSGMPAVRTPHGPPGRFVSAAAIPGGADAWSEQVWREAAQAAGEGIRAATIEPDAAAISFGDGSPMYDPVVYLSRGTGRAFLDARTREAYDRGRAASAAIIAFPEAPEVSATLLALGAATDTCGLDEGLQDECGVLRERFEEAVTAADGPGDGVDDDEPLPSSMEQAQAIADRLIRNHNEGIREETASIATDLGVEPEVVDSVRRQIEASLSRMDAAMGDGVAADRFGLSPRAFAALARGVEPAVDGVLRLRKTDELRSVEDLIAPTRYVTGVRWLLERAMGEGGLPATKAGYISPRVVAEAYDLGIVRPVWDRDAGPVFDDAARERLHEQFRPRKEADLRALLRLRALAEDAQLLRLSGNAFVVTDDARDLVDDPVALYRHLIATAFRTFEWARDDRFETPPALHAMSGFLFYAAGELCDARRSGGAAEPDADWVPVQMLVDRFIAAVPPLAEAMRTVGQGRRAADEADMGLWIRVEVQVFFVDLFGAAFGLFETKGAMGDPGQFRTTALYDAVFDRG